MDLINILKINSSSLVNKEMKINIIFPTEVEKHIIVHIACEGTK